jgi:hypothetical protein
MRNVSSKGQRRKERRVLPRNIIQTRQRITVYFEQQARESARAIFMDLNNKGAGLFTEISIPVGSKVVLELKMKHLEDEIAVPCTVAWCDKVPSTNRIIKSDPNFCWKFGVRFNAKSDEERAALKALIEAIAGKEEIKEEAASAQAEGSDPAGAVPVPQAA